MGFSFTEKDGGLLYEEQRAPLLRVFVSAFGLFMIAFSAIFIYLIFQMGEINTAAKLGGVVASVVGLVAFILFGGYCLKLALLTPTQTLFFNTKLQQIDYTTHAPAQQTTKIYTFDKIATIEAIKHVPEDGPATFSIVIILSTGDKIYIASFDNRDEANNRIERLKVLLS